jgi:hypothetical protein
MGGAVGTCGPVRSGNVKAGSTSAGGWRGIGRGSGRSETGPAPAGDSVDMAQPLR